jgi:hypothetical protein
VDGGGVSGEKGGEEHRFGRGIYAGSLGLGISSVSSGSKRTRLERCGVVIGFGLTAQKG